MCAGGDPEAGGADRVHADRAHGDEQPAPEAKAWWLLQRRQQVRRRQPPLGRRLWRSFGRRAEQRGRRETLTSSQ